MYTELPYSISFSKVKQTVAPHHTTGCFQTSRCVRYRIKRIAISLYEVKIVKKHFFYKRNIPWEITSCPPCWNGSPCSTLLFIALHTLMKNPANALLLMWGLFSPATYTKNVNIFSVCVQQTFRKPSN